MSKKIILISFLMIFTASVNVSAGEKWDTVKTKTKNTINKINKAGDIYVSASIVDQLHNSTIYNNNNNKEYKLSKSKGNTFKVGYRLNNGYSVDVRKISLDMSDKNEVDTELDFTGLAIKKYFTSKKIKPFISLGLGQNHIKQTITTPTLYTALYTDLGQTETVKEQAFATFTEIGLSYEKYKHLAFEVAVISFQNHDNDTKNYSNTALTIGMSWFF